MLIAPVQSAALVLAQQPGGGDNGGQGQDFGKSSPVGLLLLILFLVAVAFLVRSMTKHLKRVPASFDRDDEQPASEGAEPTADTGEVEDPKDPENTGAEPDEPDREKSEHTRHVGS